MVCFPEGRRWRPESRMPIVSYSTVHTQASKDFRINARISWVFNQPAPSSDYRGLSYPLFFAFGMFCVLSYYSCLFSIWSSGDCHIPSTSVLDNQHLLPWFLMFPIFGIVQIEVSLMRHHIRVLCIGTLMISLRCQGQIFVPSINFSAFHPLHICRCPVLGKKALSFIILWLSWWTLIRWSSWTNDIAPSLCSNSSRNFD